MSDKEYLIHAIWDAEAGVFSAESNVPGLNVEAATLPEFLEILQDVVPELLAANGEKHPPTQPGQRSYLHRASAYEEARDGQ